MGQQRISDIENKITRVESFIYFVFASVAILFAGLAILVMSAEKVLQVSQPVWIYLSMALAITAVAISIFARLKLEKDRWFKILIIIYLIASAVILTLLGVKVW